MWPRLVHQLPECVCNGYVVNCVLYAWIVLKAFAGVSIICRTTDQCYCLCDNIDVHLVTRMVLFIGDSISFVVA